jgi:hypothetical protein
MRETQAANGTEGQMIRVKLFLCWQYGMGFVAACNSYAVSETLPCKTLQASYQRFCDTCLTTRVVAFTSLTMLTDGPFLPHQSHLFDHLKVTAQAVYLIDRHYECLFHLMFWAHKSETTARASGVPKGGLGDSKPPPPPKFWRFDKAEPVPWNIHS